LDNIDNDKVVDADDDVDDDDNNGGTTRLSSPSHNTHSLTLSQANSASYPPWDGK